MNFTNSFVRSHFLNFQ